MNRSSLIIITSILLSTLSFNVFAERVCRNVPEWKCEYIPTPPYSKCGWADNMMCYETTGQNMIQNCEIASLSSLGYRGGNKHAFCLQNGWIGGVIPSGRGGTCFKPVPINSSALESCPRLHHLYHRTNGYGCEHLTTEDAAKLRICGR